MLPLIPLTQVHILSLSLHSCIVYMGLLAAVLALGTVGDVRPLLALALRLQQHDGTSEVTFVTHEAHQVLRKQLTMMMNTVNACHGPMPWQPISVPVLSLCRSG